MSTQWRKVEREYSDLPSVNSILPHRRAKVGSSRGPFVALTIRAIETHVTRAVREPNR